MKNTRGKILTVILLSTFFIFSGCQKKNKSPYNSSNSGLSYDFSYTGSLYLGNSLHFITTAPAGSALLWNWGDSTTSAGVTEDHSYTHAGMYIVSLTVNGDTVDRISKSISIGADSLHQSLVSGTWMCHKQTEGFYPPIEKDTTWHFSDAALVAQSIYPGAILFIGDTLFYSSSTDSTINFSSTQYAERSIPSSAMGWYNLTYNFGSNRLYFTYEYHVSAAAGEWVDTYTSF